MQQWCWVGRDSIHKEWTKQENAVEQSYVLVTESVFSSFGCCSEKFHKGTSVIETT